MNPTQVKSGLARFESFVREYPTSELCGDDEPVDHARKNKSMVKSGIQTGNPMVPVKQ